MQESIHILLVEPADNLNIGAVARSMMNLGFKHLHLVAPRKYDIAKAKITACWAEPLLHTINFHSDFESALASMELVVGFSARTGKNRPEPETLSNWSSDFISGSIPKTALVFGPEDTGLRVEHLEQCKALVRIPSKSEYPAFNLAQAVLLVLYELSRSDPQDLTPAREKPTWEQFMQLDSLIESVLGASGFLNSGTPPGMQSLLKNIFRRTSVDEREMKILLGVFGTINEEFIRHVNSKKVVAA